MEKTTGRMNTYEGTCIKCGTMVMPGKGLIERDMATDRWRTMHKAGECPAGATTTVQQSATPEALDAATKRVIELMATHMAQLVPELVQDNLALLSRVAEIKVGKMPAIKLDGVAHKALPTIVTACVAGGAPFLVGPAGSGKTTLGEQVATVLKRKFYMEARVTSEYKLLGFIDAHGKCVRTAFREAYEHGGVFLFDEVDASDADALTAFNAALANGIASFPDGMIRRHKDFVAIAAGNTFGRGADRQYVGRNQLDAATLDRFTTFEVDYDEQLELTIAGDADWTRHVQKVRAAVEAEKVRHIVSPRASIVGARYLAAGMERSDVEEACIWKGLDSASRVRVEARMGQ